MEWKEVARSSNGGMKGSYYPRTEAKIKILAPWKTGCFAELLPKRRSVAAPNDALQTWHKFHVRYLSCLVKTGRKTASAVRSRRLPRCYRPKLGNTRRGIPIFSPLPQNCCWAMRRSEAGHLLHNGPINCDLFSTGWEDSMLQNAQRTTISLSTY